MTAGSNGTPRHWRARGDQVDAITLAAGKTGLINGVNVVGLEIPRYRGSSRISYMKSYVNFFIAAARKALELSREHPYDVAIVCTMPDAAILSALPLRRAGTKLVLDVHDTMPELYRDKFPGWLGAVGVPIMKMEERLSAWCADLVLAVHEPHRQRLADYGINADKIKVVLNSPDDRIFVADGPVAKDPNTFTVVCHGTITHRMGLDLAVRAVGLLRDRMPQLRLLALGAGDYLSEIRRLVAELNLQDRVIFKDMIPIEELPKVLRTADVGLVPNRESSATHLMLPVKLLEFAMMGIPAIAPQAQDGRVLLRRQFGALLQAGRHQRSRRGDRAALPLAGVAAKLRRERAQGGRPYQLAEPTRGILSRDRFNLATPGKYQSCDCRKTKSWRRCERAHGGMMPTNKKTLVVGLGEVGGALAEVLERKHPVLKHDIERREFSDRDRRYAYLHSVRLARAVRTAGDRLYPPFQT